MLRLLPAKFISHLHHPQQEIQFKRRCSRSFLTALSSKKLYYVTFKGLNSNSGLLRRANSRIVVRFAAVYVSPEQTESRSTFYWTFVSGTKVVYSYSLCFNDLSKGPWSKHLPKNELVLRKLEIRVIRKIITLFKQCAIRVKLKQDNECFNTMFIIFYDVPTSCCVIVFTSIKRPLGQHVPY